MKVWTKSQDSERTNEKTRMTRDRKKPTKQMERANKAENEEKVQRRIKLATYSNQRAFGSFELSIVFSNLNWSN